MKTTQYVRQERAIAAADAGGIRARWFWGLRILRDPEVITESGKSLRHGITDQLIAAAKQHGFKLSDREIRYRIQCARTYQTEAQIAKAIGDFGTWFDLIQAGFPPYEAPAGEPLADHRTEAEKRRDSARRLLDLIGEQGTLFPLDLFEPAEATLKELVEYADQQDDLTARFQARGEKRRSYLSRLMAAAEGDLSPTWQAAQSLLAEEATANQDAHSAAGL